MNTKRRIPTAAWSADALLNNLAKHGWGNLSGGRWQGIRSLLIALSRSFPGRRAEGKTTAAQLADRTGLSERWIRQLLNELEELGIIAWRRGGITRGKPTPSYIQIVKEKLAELAQLALLSHDSKEALRRSEFALRLAKLRITTNQVNPTIQPKNPAPRRGGNAHAELSSRPPLNRERRGAGIPAAAPIAAALKGDKEMIAHKYSNYCDCYDCERYRPIAHQRRAAAKAKRKEEANRLTAMKKMLDDEVRAEIQRKRIEAKREDERRADELREQYPGMTSKEIALAITSQRREQRRIS